MTGRRRGRERGQLTILIIGLTVIALLGVAVVVNASNAFLQRRSLASWADGAVVEAAQAIDHRQIYAGSSSARLPLSESAARDAVGAYVARHGLADRFTRFRVTSVDMDEASGRITVRLAASVPLVMMDGLAATPIRADASAVGELGP